MTMQRRQVLAMGAIGALAWSGVRAAGFPERPMTMVVPYGAGGPTDTVGRLIANEMEGVLRQRMVVMNRPGASGTIGISEVARAAPDGYTIGYATAAIVGLQPLIIGGLPYRGTEGYQPILKLFDVPIALGVPADSPYRTLDDFVKAARAKPGGLRVGVAGKLTEPDLVMELFKSVGRFDVINVPFTGGSRDSVNATMGGHVEAFAAAVTLLPGFVQGGKIRLLTVFHGARSPLFPQVPTAKESGFDVSLPAMHFMMGPKGMAADRVETLRAAMAGILKGEKFTELRDKSGFYPDPLGPEALGREIAQYSAVYDRLVTDLKIPRAS